MNTNTPKQTPIHRAPTLPALEVWDDERPTFYTSHTMGSDERDALEVIDFSIAIDLT